MIAGKLTNTKTGDFNLQCLFNDYFQSFLHSSPVHLHWDAKKTLHPNLAEKMLRTDGAGATLK